MNAADMHRVWKNSVRLFFAPLRGAIKGAIREVRRVDLVVQQDQRRARRASGPG